MPQTISSFFHHLADFPAEKSTLVSQTPKTAYPFKMLLWRCVKNTLSCPRSYTHFLSLSQQIHTPETFHPLISQSDLIPRQFFVSGRFDARPIAVKNVVDATEFIARLNSSVCVVFFSLLWEREWSGCPLRISQFRCEDGLTFASEKIISFSLKERKRKRRGRSLERQNGSEIRKSGEWHFRTIRIRKTVLQLQQFYCCHCQN